MERGRGEFWRGREVSLLSLKVRERRERWQVARRRGSSPLRQAFSATSRFSLLSLRSEAESSLLYPLFLPLSSQLGASTEYLVSLAKLARAEMAGNEAGESRHYRRGTTKLFSRAHLWKRMMPPPRPRESPSPRPFFPPRLFKNASERNRRRTKAPLSLTCPVRRLEGVPRPVHAVGGVAGRRRRGL